MRQLLTDNEFYIFTQCNCGGTRQEKYKSGKYATLEVHVEPNRGFFRILQGGRQIDQGQTMSLDNKLQLAISETEQGRVRFENII